MTAPGGRPAARRRVLASVGDYGVIVGWLGGLTAVSFAGRAVVGRPPAPSAMPASPVSVDLAVFAMTVLPVGAYLAAAEAGRHHATAGKRWQGLRVTTGAGGRVRPRQAVVRNAVKLLPWQLGHIAAARWIRGNNRSPVGWAAYGLSLLMAASTVAVAVRDREGRALHDLVARTRVVDARDEDRAQLPCSSGRRSLR